MRFVGLIMAFLVVVVLGFLVIGFTSTQPVPNSSTVAGQQYTNLTATVEIGYSGINGGLLLLLLAIVLAAMWMIIKAIS